MTVIQCNLFIYAATGLLFITDEIVSYPQGQLATILDGHRGSDDNPYTTVDDQYLRVLDIAVSQDTRSRKHVWSNVYVVLFAPS